MVSAVRAVFESELAASRLVVFAVASDGLVELLTWLLILLFILLL